MSEPAFIFDVTRLISAYGDRLDMFKAPGLRAWGLATQVAESEPLVTDPEAMAVLQSYLRESGAADVDAIEANAILIQEIAAERASGGDANLYEVQGAWYFEAYTL